MEKHKKGASMISWFHINGYHFICLETNHTQIPHNHELRTTYISY